jgi:ATP-dependent Lon protease
MSDSQVVSSKTHQMTLRNKKVSEKLSKKKFESSDSDSGSDSDYIEEEEDCDDETMEDDDEEEENISQRDYRLLLSKIFPSKYIEEKTKNTPMNKMLSGSSKGKSSKIFKSETYEEDEEEDIKEPIKKRAKTSSKRKIKECYESEASESESDNSDLINQINKLIKQKNKVTAYGGLDACNNFLDRELTRIAKEKKGNVQKFNIIFPMGGSKFLEPDSDVDEEDEDIYTCSDEEDADDDDYDENSDEEESEQEEMCDEETNDVSESSADESNTISKLSDEEIVHKFTEMANLLKKSGNKDSQLLKILVKSTKKARNAYQKEKAKQEKKEKVRNLKQFKGLLKNKNVLNDVAFFKQKLTLDEQKKVLSEMSAIQKISKVEKPYRLTLLESDIPTHFKACAFKKLDQLRYMRPGDGEYYKIKNWIDTFMQIPFNIRSDLPIKLDDGVDKCHEFMENAKKFLDSAVFGLNDAKLQIMQMVGQWISNPDAIGTAIAIKGPMGTGKTTLVKDGISKILNREFAFIALGGATDSSFLEGHSYTYEGSTWGKIVDILLRCKSMNPVIYFDELDKVSETPKGEEIIGILTHLTDTSQNSKFHDKYFSEIDFDLSKCLFIFSYNDESKVNPILRDRMYKINTSGYKDDEKSIIATDYLLPHIREQVNILDEQIKIPKETIDYIIQRFTDDEKGVRNLKRCLEIVYTKLNLYRLMKPGTNLFEKDMSLSIQFPLIVTNEMVDKLIKKDKIDSMPYGMYT